MKGKRRSPWVTALVNFLFIAAIAVVGWKIYTYVSDSRETTELAEDLWSRAAMTAAPAAEAEIRQAEPIPPAAPEKQALPTVSTTDEAPEATTAPEAPEADPPQGHPAMTAESRPEPTSGETAQEAKRAPAPDDTEPDKTEPDETEPDETAPAETKAAVTDELKAAAAATVFLTPAPSATAVPRFTDAPDLPVSIDFSLLKEVNQDTAAWLYQTELEINLPVVHTDNNQYYLKHGLDGTRKDSGTLFIDCRNTGDFSERHTIIYGHARKDRHMFGNLKNYQDAAFCEANPFLYLYLPGHRFRLEIVAVGDTKDASPFYALPANEEWDRLLQDMIEKSPYDFGIPVDPGDHYVTLSTCAYDYEDERWLVVARIDDPEGILPSMAEE